MREMLLFIGLLIVLCIGVLTYSKWSPWFESLLSKEGFQAASNISYTSLLELDKEQFTIAKANYSRYESAWSSLYTSGGPGIPRGLLYEIKSKDETFRTKYIEFLFLDQVRQGRITLLEYVKPDLPDKINYFALQECYNTQQAEYPAFLAASNWLKANAFPYMDHRLVWSRVASPDKWNTIARLRRELRRIQLRHELLKTWVSVKRATINIDQELTASPLNYGAQPPPPQAGLPTLVWVPQEACLRQGFTADIAKEQLIYNQFWWWSDIEQLYATQLASLNSKYATLSSYTTRATFAYQCKQSDWDTYSAGINERLINQIQQEEEALKAYYARTEPSRNTVTKGTDFTTTYITKYECLDFDYDYYDVYINFLTGDPENADINFINGLLLSQSPPITNVLDIGTRTIPPENLVLTKLKQSIQTYLSSTSPSLSISPIPPFTVSVNPLTNTAEKVQIKELPSTIKYHGTITPAQKGELERAFAFANQFSLQDPALVSKYIRISRVNRYKDPLLSQANTAVEVYCIFIKNTIGSLQCHFDIAQIVRDEGPNSRFETLENPQFSMNSGQCDRVLTAEAFSLLPTATRNFLQQFLVNQTRRLQEFYGITRPFVFLGQDKTLEAQILLARGQATAVRDLWNLAMDVRFVLPEESPLWSQANSEVNTLTPLMRNAPTPARSTPPGSFDSTAWGISYFFPKPTPVDFSRTIYLNALAQKFYQELGGRFAISQIFDVSTLGSSIVDMRFDVAYHGNPLELYQQIQALKANYEKFKNTMVASDIQEDSRFSFFNKLYDLQQKQDENIENVFTGLHGRFFYHLENGVFIVDGFTLDRRAVTSYLPSANGGLPVAQFSQPGNVSYSPVIQYTYNITPQMDCTTLEGVKAILSEYKDIIYTEKVKRQVTNPRDGGYAWDLSGQLWIKQIVSSQKLNDNQCAIKWVESVIDRGLNTEITVPVNRKDITRRAIFTQVKNTDQWFATDLTMDLSGFYFLPSDSGAECRIEPGRSNAYKAGESPCPSVNGNAKVSPFLYGALNPTLYTTVGRNLKLLQEDFEKTQLTTTVPTTRRLLAPAWNLLGSGATVFNQSLPQPLPQEYDLDTRDSRCPARTCSNPRALYEIMSAWNNSTDSRVTGKILRVKRAVTASPNRCDLEYEVERNGAVTTESRRFIVQHSLPDCILQIDFDETFNPTQKNGYPFPTIELFSMEKEGFQSGTTSTGSQTNATFLRGASSLTEPVEYTTEFVKGTFSDQDLGEASTIIKDTATDALATIQPTLDRYKTNTDQLKNAIQTDTIAQYSEREVSVTTGEVDINLFTKVRITFYTARELGTRIGLRYIFLQQGTGFLDLYLSKIVAQGYQEQDTNKLRPFDFESQASYSDTDAVYFTLPVTLEVQLDRGYIVDGFSFMTGPNSEEDPVEWDVKGVTADNKIITLQSMKPDITTPGDFTKIREDAFKRLIPSDYYSSRLNQAVTDYNTNYATYAKASADTYKPIQDMIDTKQRLIDLKTAADTDAAAKKQLYDTALGIQNTRLESLRSAATALETAYEACELTRFVPYFDYQDPYNIWDQYSFIIGTKTKAIPTLYGKYYAETGKVNQPATLTTSNPGIYGNPLTINATSSCSLPGTGLCLYAPFQAVSPFSRGYQQVNLGLFPEYRNITPNTSIRLLSKQLQYINFVQSTRTINVDMYYDTVPNPLPGGQVVGWTNTTNGYKYYIRNVPTSVPFLYIDGVPYPSIDESFTSPQVQQTFPEYNDPKVQTLKARLNEFRSARTEYDTAVTNTNTTKTNYNTAVAAQATAASNLAANAGSAIDQINAAKQAIEDAGVLISQRANNIKEKEALLTSKYEEVKLKATALANALDLASSDDFIGSIKNIQGLSTALSLKQTDRSFNTNTLRPYNWDMVVVYATSITPDTTKQISNIDAITTTGRFLSAIAAGPCIFGNINASSDYTLQYSLSFGSLPPGPYPLYPGIANDAYIKRLGKKTVAGFDQPYTSGNLQCKPYTTTTGKPYVQLYAFPGRPGNPTQNDIDELVRLFPSYNHPTFLAADQALLNFINIRNEYNITNGLLNTARVNYQAALDQKKAAEATLASVYSSTGFSAYQNAEKARLDYLRTLQLKLLINLYPPYEWYRTSLYSFQLTEPIQSLEQNNFRPKDITECQIEAYTQEILIELDNYIQGPYRRSLPSYSTDQSPVPIAYIDSITRSSKNEKQNSFIYTINLIQYAANGDMTTPQLNLFIQLQETFNCTILFDTIKTKVLQTSNTVDAALLASSSFTPFPAIQNPPFTRCPPGLTIFRFRLTNLRGVSATTARLAAIQFFKGDTKLSLSAAKAICLEDSSNAKSLLLADPLAANPVTSLQTTAFSVSSTKPATIIISNNTAIDADSFSFMTGPDSYEDPLQWTLEKSESGVWKTVHIQSTNATYPDYAWWRLARTPFLPTGAAPTPLPQNPSRLKGILESGIQPNDYRIVKALSDYVYLEMSKTMPGYSVTKMNAARRYLSGLLSYSINNHDDLIIYRPKIHELTNSYTLNKFDVDTTTTRELTVRFQRNVESRLTLAANPITDAPKGSVAQTPFPAGDLVNLGTQDKPFAWGGYPEVRPTFTAAGAFSLASLYYPILSFQQTQPTAATVQAPATYSAGNTLPGIDREGLAQICAADPDCIGFYDAATGTADSQKGGAFLRGSAQPAPISAVSTATINGLTTPRIYMKSGVIAPFTALRFTFKTLRSPTATDIQLAKIGLYYKGELIRFTQAPTVSCISSAGVIVTNNTANNLFNYSTSTDFIAPFSTTAYISVYFGQAITADSFVFVTNASTPGNDPIAWTIEALPLSNLPNATTAPIITLFTTTTNIIPTTARYQYYPRLAFAQTPTVVTDGSVPTTPTALNTYTKGKTLQDCQAVCTNPNVMLNIRNTYLAANPQTAIGVTGGVYDAEKNECVLEIVKTTTGTAERIGFDFDLIYGDCATRISAQGLTGTLNPAPTLMAPVVRLSNPDLPRLQAQGYPILSFTKIRFRPLALVGGGAAVELGKLVLFTPSNTIASFTPLSKAAATVLSPSGTDGGTAQTLLNLTNFQTSWRDSQLGAVVFTLQNLGASFTLFTGADPTRAPIRWILEGTKDDKIWYTLWDQSQADDTVPTSPYSAYRRFYIDNTTPNISTDLPAITEMFIKDTYKPADDPAFLVPAQTFLKSMNPPVNFIPIQFYADTTTNKVTYKLRDNRIVEVWFYINNSRTVTGAYAAKIFAPTDPYPTVSYATVAAGRFVYLNTACSGVCGNPTILASAKTVYQATDFRTDPTEQPKSYPFEVGSYAFDAVQNQCIYTMNTTNLPAALAATQQVAIPFLVTIGATSCGSTALGSATVQATPTMIASTAPTLTSTSQLRYFRLRNIQTRNPASPTADVSRFNFFNKGATSNGLVLPGNGVTALTDTRSSMTTTQGTGSKTLVSFDYGTSAQLIHGFNFTTNASNPDADPVSWTLEGSADGITWTLLQQQTNWPTVTDRGCRMPIWFFNHMNTPPFFMDNCAYPPVSLKDCRTNLTETAVLADALAQVPNTNTDPTLNQNIITGSAVSWDTNEVIFRTEDGTQLSAPVALNSIKYGTAKLACTDATLLSSIPKTFGPTMSSLTIPKPAYVSTDSPTVIRIRFPKPPGSSAISFQLSRLYFFTQANNATLPALTWLHTSSTNFDSYISKTTFPSKDIFLMNSQTTNETSFTLNYDTTYILVFKVTLNTLRGLSLLTGADPSQAPTFITADYTTDGKVYKTLLPIQAIAPPTIPYMSYANIYFDGTVVTLPSISTYVTAPTYNHCIEYMLNATSVPDTILLSALNWCMAQTPQIAFIPRMFSIDPSTKLVRFLMADGSLLQFNCMYYKYNISTGSYSRLFNVNYMAPSQIGSTPVPTTALSTANLKFLDNCMATPLSSTTQPPASVLTAAANRLKQDYPGSEFVATQFGLDSARNRVYFKLDDLYVPPLLQGVNVGFQFQPSVGTSCPTTRTAISPLDAQPIGANPALTMNTPSRTSVYAIKYLRFVPTKTRNPNAPSVRFERFAFFVSNATSTGFTQPLPGIYATFSVLNRLGSWTGTNTDLFGTGASPNPFIDTNKKALEFISSTNTTTFFGYSFTTSTAPNSQDSDPVSWRMEGSTNGILWTPIHTKTDYATPIERGACAEVFVFDEYSTTGVRNYSVTRSSC